MCRLDSADEHVSGKPVFVAMELRNQDDSARYMLKWYTPFEGIAGEIFTVEHDGGAVKYQGPLAKRGEPVASDYIEITAGALAEPPWTWPRRTISRPQAPTESSSSQGSTTSQRWRTRCLARAISIVRSDWSAAPSASGC